MKFNIKKRFNSFLNNAKEYPLLAGFFAGFYPMVFITSNNFDLVNSWQQSLFFFFYYIVFPSASSFIFYKLMQQSNYSKYTSRGMFLIMVLFLTFFLIDIPVLFGSYKRIVVFLVFFAVILFSKIDKYKYLVVFIALMSIIPLYKLAQIFVLNYTNSTEWQKQPDAILNSKFIKTPNIYYIQPDGYASELNLKGALYQFDNSKFDNWLKNKKFTLYDSFRSNYESTLFSNSSCFYMKHHFSNEFSKFKYARDLIVGDNPVLKIFKNNKYKTFFITERPYLLMNRPKVYYDFTNFKLNELPYFNDGWSSFKEITAEIKKQIVANKNSKNFFFIEKFKPGHIAVYEKGSKGVEGERVEYIKNVKMANAWLMEMISFIEKYDPNSIVIIGADHGGFVGFKYALEAQKKVADRALLYSIFGAKLAIKWNNPKHEEYDSKLKTPVNLFRILFSYLSENKLPLEHLQPDTSYNCYDSTDFTKIYKAIDENGSSQFLRIKSRK